MQSSHPTLVGNAVTRITLTGSAHLEVMNRGVTDVFFTYSISGEPADPTLSGNGCGCAPATPANASPTPITLTVSPNNATVVVKLISSGTPAVTVHGRTSLEAIAGSV